MRFLSVLRVWFADAGEWHAIKAACGLWLLPLAGLASVWAWWVSGQMLGGVLAAAYAVILALLARIDLKTLTLPNALVIPLLLVGLLLAPFNGLGYTEAFGSAMFAASALMFLGEAVGRLTGRHALGMGDVKLLAAIAAWVGTYGVLLTLLVGSWVAMAYVFKLKWRGQTEELKGKIPFGPFLALGGWVAYVYTPWFMSFLRV